MKRLKEKLAKPGGAMVFLAEVSHRLPERRPDG
ncbi:MAG: hypothetical protein ACI8QI_001093 [Limisphaerales bacterium]|jgi:hypothetical protein